MTESHHAPDLAAMGAYEVFCASSWDRLGLEPPRWDQIPPGARAAWRAVAGAVAMIGDAHEPVLRGAALHRALDMARSEGVAGERERCAQLAEFHQIQVDVYDPFDDLIGPEWLADIIRKGGETP